MTVAWLLLLAAMPVILVLLLLGINYTIEWAMFAGLLVLGLWLFTGFLDLRKTPYRSFNVYLLVVARWIVIGIVLIPGALLLYRESLQLNREIVDLPPLLGPLAIASYMALTRVIQILTGPSRPSRKTIASSVLLVVLIVLLGVLSWLMTVSSSTSS